MISILRVAVCLLVLCSHANAFDDDEEKLVTCGSAIKMTHVDTGGKYYLHSANAQMGSGSGQQVVTMVEDRSAVGGLWLVREGHGEPQCKPAEPIPCGRRIRLTHLETSVNLHSHLVKSPLSNQQEVSGFGSDGEGDSGDSWIVACTNKNDKYWKRNEKVRLQHGDTSKYLGASDQAKYTQQNCGSRCPILNQLETFGRTHEDNMSLFKVELGVHLSK
eukprot:CAMPEP_0198281936 /NCGR_PEP_ID=MMETSP1449-20131203/1816_1 /TAXON_ID=420275 /ORGANISM="Attheya septentrionalis, Strain CCMP2084" /LENGTH=217 /DNA_ID=CAMNT_0043977963 /DNA_START=129 /DNA_END=782 /DNA_ORIENTATION=-